MENIYTSVRPFLGILTCLGLFPMRFVGPIGNGTLKIKSVEAFVSLLMMTIAVSSIGINFMFLSFYTSLSVIISMSWTVCWMIGLISLVLMMIYQWYKCSEISVSLKLLNDVDERVNERYYIDIYNCYQFFSPD